MPIKINPNISPKTLKNLMQPSIEPTLNATTSNAQPMESVSVLIGKYSSSEWKAGNQDRQKQELILAARFPSRVPLTAIGTLLFTYIKDLDVSL